MDDHLALLQGLQAARDGGLQDVAALLLGLLAKRLQPDAQAWRCKRKGRRQKVMDKSMNLSGAPILGIGMKRFMIIIINA